MRSVFKQLSDNSFYFHVVSEECAAGGIRYDYESAFKAYHEAMIWVSQRKGKK